jgi:hypothetical protein
MYFEYRLISWNSKNVFKRLEEEHLGYAIIDKRDLVCKKSM